MIPLARPTSLSSRTAPACPTLVQDVQSGTLNFQADGSFSYTSDAGFKGTDSFRYGDPSDPAQQTMAYRLVHRQPSAHGDFCQTTPEVPITIGSVPSVPANDADIQQVQEIVNLAPITGPDNGTLTLNEDGTFLYGPNPGFVGEDIFTYEVAVVEDRNGPDPSCENRLTQFASIR